MQSFILPFSGFFFRLREAIWTILLGYLILRVSLLLLSRAIHILKLSAEIKGLILNLLAVLLWLLYVIAIIFSFGFNKLALGLTGSAALITALLTSGAREFVVDLIAGIYLAKDKNFKIGLKVKIGDIEGRIKAIDIRKVRLEDKNGIIYVIANSEVDKKGWAVLNDDQS